MQRLFTSSFLVFTLIAGLVMGARSQLFLMPSLANLPSTLQEEEEHRQSHHKAAKAEDRHKGRTPTLEQGRLRGVVSTLNSTHRCKATAPAAFLQTALLQALSGQLRC